MKQIDDYLEQIYKLTEKIEQFLCSELEFDVKVEQVEEMMTRRAELFAAIDDSDGAKPRDYRRKIAILWRSTARSSAPCRRCATNKNGI